MGLEAASIAVALLLTAQDQRPTLPLVIAELGIETNARRPTEGNVVVTVLNTGQRTIFAWGYRFVLMHPDGTTEGRLGISGDAAAALPEGQQRAAIAPGARGHSPPGGAGVSTTLRVLSGAVSFVIFDDDTALGDEFGIASIFRQRRIRQGFWQKMEAILDDATAHESDPTVVLSLIRQRMETEPDPTFRGFAGWYNDVLVHISGRRADVSRMTRQQVLDWIRTTVPAQKANADAHAVRR